MNPQNFYLGFHHPSKIGKTSTPLFISFRQLRNRKKKPFNNESPIYIDSGGFTELNLNGHWTITPEEYSNELLRLKSLNLNFNWVSQQDWMCEEIVLSKTKNSILDHQLKTCDNFATLIDLDDGISYTPVIQGQKIHDYISHIDMFKEYGFDLSNQSIVGVGSVCRRQNTEEIFHLFKELHSMNLNLHGFGVKTLGLKKYHQYLTSCDSLAWSLHSRLGNKKCNSCLSNNNKNCANCLQFAENWRKNILSSIFNPTISSQPKRRGRVVDE